MPAHPEAMVAADTTRTIRNYRLGFVVLWWFWMFQSIFPYESVTTAIVLAAIYALGPVIFCRSYAQHISATTPKYAQFTQLFLLVMIPWMVRAVVFGAIFGFFFGILFSFFVNNSSDRVVAFFINPIAWAFFTAILGGILGAVLATERYDSTRQAPDSLPERAFAYQTNAVLESTLAPVSKMPLGWVTAFVILFAYQLLQGEAIIMFGALLGALFGVFHGRIVEHAISKLLQPSVSWADLWKQLTFAEIDWPTFFHSWSWAKSMFVASLWFWLFEGAVMGGFIGHAFNLRQDGPFTLPMPFLFWELDNLVYQPTDQISQRYGVDLAFVYRVGAHVGLFGASVDVVRILTEWVLRRFAR